MATWNQVTELLKSQYPIEKEGSDFLMINFATIGTRTQRVLIGVDKHPQLGEWINIASPIGTIPAGTLDQALLAVGNLPVGGLVKFEDTHFLRDTMLLATITPEELNIVLALITTLADGLEATLVGGDTH